MPMKTTARARRTGGECPNALPHAAGAHEAAAAAQEERPASVFRRKGLADSTNSSKQSREGSGLAPGKESAPAGGPHPRRAV